MSQVPIEITCANKPYTFSGPEAITEVGGSGWTSPAWQIVAILENKFSPIFYFTSFQGRVTLVEVVEMFGKKFLRTSPDGVPGNNLENLGMCP